MYTVILYCTIVCATEYGACSCVSKNDESQNVPSSGTLPTDNACDVYVSSMNSGVIDCKVFVDPQDKVIQVASTTCTAQIIKKVSELKLK